MTRHTHANQSPLKELSVDAIVELLRANGMRVTKNRLQILDTLLRAEKPLSLDEIRHKLTPEIRCVYVQATESSTGARHDVEAIAKLVGALPDTLCCAI